MQAIADTQARLNRIGAERKLQESTMPRTPQLAMSHVPSNTFYPLSNQQGLFNWYNQLQQQVAANYANQPLNHPAFQGMSWTDLWNDYINRPNFLRRDTFGDHANNIISDYIDYIYPSR